LNESDFKPIPPANPDHEEIRSWMVSYMAELLQMDPTEVDTSMSFEAYGLDSTAAAGLSADLGEWLGLELDVSMASEFPTIDAVVEYLIEELAVRD
jgi:acyl carrier protein